MKKVIFFFAAMMTAATMMAQTPTVSVSSVTFKYCQTTSETDVIKVKTGFPYTWQDSLTFNEPGSYTVLLKNVRGCDSILTLVLVEHAGDLPGVFSVSGTKKVQFSMGNLQYRATKNGVVGDLTHAVAGGTVKNGEWRFAPEQWTVVGAVNGGETQTKWRDLFGWGCDGNGTTRPWTTTTQYNDGYSAYHPTNGGDVDFSSAGANYDWGVYNAIVNGGNEPGMWFTLTKAEWSYLISSRSGASSKRSCATVNGVKGYILLPDTWTIPTGLSFTANASSYATNSYSGDNWTKMENAGAVFLPCAGYRESSSSISQQTWGLYYTGTFAGTSHDSSYDVIFYESSSAAAIYYGVNGGSTPSSNNNCAGWGMSVRLVKLVQ